MYGDSCKYNLSPFFGLHSTVISLGINFIVKKKEYKLFFLSIFPKTLAPDYFKETSSINNSTKFIIIEWKEKNFFLIFSHL